MKVYNTYVEELKDDARVDELSLKEKALHMPGIKAKWVSRLIMHKNSLRGLEKQKGKILGEITEKIKSDSPIKLHHAVLQEKAESLDPVRDLTDKIADEKLLIDFLERAEKIFTSMSFDISNIIKIVQLETT